MPSCTGWNNLVCNAVFREHLLWPDPSSVPRVSETLLTLFSWINLYIMTITNYGQPASLLADNWTGLTSIPLTFLVTLLVHVIPPTQPNRLHQTDIVSVAILCLPRARGLRWCRHSFNFGGRSDFKLYHIRRDVRNCTAIYTPPSPRIIFQMEMGLYFPRNTLHVHRSVEHIILVLLPHTPTDRCQTVSGVTSGRRHFTTTSKCNDAEPDGSWIGSWCTQLVLLSHFYHYIIALMMFFRDWVDNLVRIYFIVFVSGIQQPAVYVQHS